MPIKLPKGFQRRKSSQNALEEVQNPPESSFRVFERPPGKSFDASRNLRKPLPDPGLDDEDEDLFPASGAEPKNRIGGGIENSTLGTGPYNSAASSARLSSSSTVPSSVSVRSDVNKPLPKDRAFRDIPVPPESVRRSTFSLRSSGRSFSFGTRSGHHDIAPRPSESDVGRDRAATASSASTATPPRLFDSDLSLDGSDMEGFGHMFDNIGMRNSRDASPNRLIQSPVGRFTLHRDRPNRAKDQQAKPSPPTHFGLPQHLRANLAASSPNLADNTQGFESSPYSWTSRDGLMRSPSPSKTVTQHSPESPSSQHPLPFSHTARPPPGSAYTESRQYTSEPLNNHLVDSGQTSAKHPQAGPRQSRRESEPPSPVRDLFPTNIDPTIVANAGLAAQWEDIKTAVPPPPSTKKVMTPAQFERYRQQQEFSQSAASPNGESGGDSDNYDDDDDDDDTERDRQAAKQRRQQEAHLAVYRQTMMKVTGEQSSQRAASGQSGLHSRHPRSPSYDLSNRMSFLSANGHDNADEGEDEDVPLGILAAHGFPNKNRPPTRLAASNSAPSLSLPLPAPAGSVVGEPTQRGSLPVFARNLPRDPYFGAGLVNQSNRESFAMGGGASVQGALSPGIYPVHPAGLVGVIAGEERARAIRRGSPNEQGSFDASAMSQNQAMYGYPGMPMPMSPAEQVQLESSQQMMQMMQVQMQWMQQMMQMQGQGQPGPPQMPPTPGMGMNGFLAPPNNGQLSRPQSIINGPPLPPAHGRTMSSLSPSMASWNRPPSFAPPSNVGGRPGYEPSIAPSERSNVGLAPRYRPVSMIPDTRNNFSKRSSTLTSSIFRPWASSDNLGQKTPASTIRAVGTTNLIRAAAADDEDDDQGWAEMKKKRDKKKSAWKLKREKSEFGI